MPPSDVASYELNRLATSALAERTAGPLATLTQCVRQAKADGASDADIMLAVAASGGEFDGLRVFCWVNGQLMKLIGAWGLVLLEALALLALLSKIVETSEQIWTWMQDKLGGILAIVTALGGIGALGFLGYALFSDEEKKKKDTSVTAITTSALKGAIIGLFPGMIQGALVGVAVEMGGMLGIGPGGKDAIHNDTEEDEGYDAETLEAVADYFEVPVNDIIQALP